MSKALTIFDNNKLAMPSHVADAFAEEKNINDRVTVPSLTYEGKVWSVSIDGVKTKVTKKDEDGDVVPVQTMRVVVLDFAKRRGRAYYEGTYDPAKPGSPLCWSDDGVKPHESVPEPKCSTCDKCPLAAKGSKITDSGKAVTACSQHRMIVVAPLQKLDMPLRLKLAITSDWDKQSPELEKEGWFAFNNYTDFLRTRNINHTAAVVTKMAFDPNVAFPKVIFSPDRWLNEDELDTVKPVIKSDEVKQLLSGTWTPAGVDGTKIAPPADVDDEEEPAPKSKAKAKVVDDDDEEPAPKSKAKAKAPVEDDDEEPAPKVKAKAKVVDDDEEPAPKAKTKAKPKVADDDDEETPAPKKAAKAKAEEPKSGDADVPEAVAGLLEEWGDD